ncbi:MAG TPA: MBL fold metallo-hydrolase [Egibacteraceae bacterium]|nr:MBL fold metallo-hydrolase [Egibacteraceae bacterium]
MDHEPLILLDFGSGLPDVDPTDSSVSQTTGRIVAFVSHLHLDHVIGLPFFPPLHQEGTELDIYGPPQPSGSLADAFAALIRPPFFPLQLADVRATVRFHEVFEDDLAVGGVKVKVRPVPHLGPTVGYRFEQDGFAFAYVSDHQAPPSFEGVSDPVLELCDGVDVLIHEAQYTHEEFARKPDWGHCTPAYALLVAKESVARCLCLYHHDPRRSDEELDSILADIRQESEGTPVAEILAAAEGMSLARTGSVTPSRLIKGGGER